MAEPCPSPETDGGNEMDHFAEFSMKDAANNVVQSACENNRMDCKFWTIVLGECHRVQRKSGRPV